MLRLAVAVGALLLAVTFAQAGTAKHSFSGIPIFFVALSREWLPPRPRLGDDEKWTEPNFIRALKSVPTSVSRNAGAPRFGKHYDND
jgi:hypothetical protein